MGLFQTDNRPTSRLSGIRLSQAVLGTTLPILVGQHRLSWKLLWYGAFTNSVAKQQGGGSGAGKGGSQYVYTASVVGGICMGPCANFLGVWDSIGRYAMQSEAENVTLPSSGPITYTPLNQANFKQDLGVGISRSFSVNANDYGSPGLVTLSGTQQGPLVYTTSPTPGPGQYTITGLPTTPVYVFNAAQAGASVNVYYVAYRYFITEEELQIAAASVTVQYQSEFNNDNGVSYYPSGVALTPVSGTPSIAGTYNPNGGHYLFAPADFGLGVTISYTYKDPNTDTNAPTTLNLSFFGGALGQAPWSYLSSGFPNDALGYSEIAYVGSVGLYLGYSPVLPQLNFEILGPYAFGNGIPDANPADAIFGLLSNPTYKYNVPTQVPIDVSLLGKYVTTGSVTSGTFTANEVVKQSTTGASAMLIGTVTGSNPMATFLISGTPDATHTWVGQTSGAIFTPTALPTSSSARAMWSANNFFLSDILDSQTSLMDTISRWCEAGQVYMAWDEGLLKFIPLSDTTAVGNGVVYSPPTQPVIDLDDNDFVVEKNKDPISITQTPWQNRWNRVSVRWSVRSNDYNEDILQIQDEASVQQFGLLSETAQDYQFICTQAAAQFAANMRLQRLSAIYTTYSFTLRANFAFLSPGDIVTVVDGLLNTSGTMFGRTPVRITKMTDDPIKGVVIEAENFPWSVGTSLLYNKQAAIPSNTNDGPQEDPGNTIPVIFEVPNQAAQWSGGIIYIFANGSNVNWGGFQVFVSFNGTDYNFYGQYTKPARIGVTTADLPFHADPDNTDTLTVNMQQSGAVLQSVTAADLAAFVTLSAVVSPGSTFNLQKIAGSGQNVGTSATGGSTGTAGPNAVTSVSDTPGSSTTPWTNLPGVEGSSTYTNATTSTSGGTSGTPQTDFLGTGALFSVPSPGIGPIIGVTVSFKAYYTLVSGSLGASIPNVEAWFYGGQGTAKSQPLTTTPTTYTLGGPADLWGLPPGTFDAFEATTAPGIGPTIQGNAFTAGASSVQIFIQDVVVSITWAAAGAAIAWTNPNQVASTSPPFAQALLTTADISQWLLSQGFSFNLPFGFILSGIEVTVHGNNGGAGSSSGVLSAMLSYQGQRIGSLRTIPLPANGGFAQDLTIGTPTDTWGAQGVLDVVALNDPSFGVMLMGSGSFGDAPSLIDVRITLFGTSATNLELIAYESATLVGQNTYALTTLRRGLLGSFPCDHPSGSTFARLDQATLEYQVPSNFTGSVIYFKFLSFNAYGNQLQSLPNVTPYAVEIGGLSPGAIDLKTGALRTGTPNFSVTEIEPVVAAAHGSWGIQNIPSGYIWAGNPALGSSGPPVWIPGLTAGGGGGGSFANLLFVFVSAAYAALIWDYISCDTTSAGFTVTLPLAASSPDTMIAVKLNKGTHPVTVGHSGSDTVEGASSFQITNPGEAIYLVSDGVSNWEIFAGWDQAVLPAANTGDTIRWNLYGDGKWDAVSAGLVRSGTIFYNVQGNALQIVGTTYTGTAAPILASGQTFTIVNPTSVDGWGLQYNAAATASLNTVLAVVYPEQTNFGLEALATLLRLGMRWAAGNTTNVRYWFGVTVFYTSGSGGETARIENTSSFANDTPNRSFIGFRFSAGTDTTWKAVTIITGGAVTIVDTLIPIDTNPHTFEFTYDGAHAVFFIDGNIVATISTVPPSSSYHTVYFWSGDNKNTATAISGTTFWITWENK